MTATVIDEECDCAVALRQVQSKRADVACGACGSLLVWRGSLPDARVCVATAERLRPSAVPPVARLTHVEDGELVRVRRLLCELRPDKGGPLGWAADGQAPAALGSNWTPALRVQTSVEVPAILPGAFASQARESTAPRLDPSSVLGWLQRHGTLSAGLRALYADCAEAMAPVEVRAKWKALAPRDVLGAAVVYGRKRVLAAMAEWWREPGADLAPAETAADRAERVDEMAGQAERTSAEVRRALARVYGRSPLTPTPVPVSNAAIGLPLPAVDVRPATAGQAHDPASE